MSLRTTLKSLIYRPEGTTGLRERLANSRAKITSAQKPDPVLDVIEEGRRLLQASRAAYAIADVGIDPNPEKTSTQDAAWEHFRGPLLQTVPATPQGCVEMARYAIEFQDFQGVDLDTELLAILGLIARSPLLATADFGTDRHIAELASKFCTAYREHAEVDRAVMAGELSEAEWNGPYDAVVAQAKELAAATPTTLAGVALKCLGPVGIQAWQFGANDDPAELDQYERIAAEVQAAILGGTHTPILPGASSQSRLSPTRQWAVEQAAKVSLTGLDILQLHNLYGLFSDAADRWSAAACVPWAHQNPESPFHTLTAGGETVEREEQRAAEIRNRIVAEIRTKEPTGSLEHGWRLAILIRHELLCEGSLRHAPELRAEITKAWGG